MRDHLVFYVNGRRHTVADADATLTLSDYLRVKLRQVGTKIVCAEGDCGACSVLVGRPTDDDPSTLQYQAIDACIAFLHQFDRTHIVTVEGLKVNGTLSPVQDAMVRCHGSQCGFCTPGFVVTMHGLFERANGGPCAPLGDAELRSGLTGNLCRCTGYVQIIDAGRSVDPAKVARIRDLYHDQPMLEDFRRLGDAPVLIVAPKDGVNRTVFLPATLAQAARFKAEYPDATVVSGATDLGVQHNHGKIEPDTILSLTSIPGLDCVAVEDDTLILGARATWSRIESFVKDLLPEYHRVLTHFGGPQVRNLGTVGGNLANASPIADAIPFHMVMNAELELLSPRGTRRVNVNDFYLGYKKLDLAADELIARVLTPLPAGDERLKLYKVSKRLDLDISTFTAAVLLKRDGEMIRSARLAYGGVAPVVLRLPKTEAYLAGKPLAEDTMRAAGKIARTEITPITDVRGSADFRMQLAENILVKCYFDLQMEMASV